MKMRTRFLSAFVIASGVCLQSLGVYALGQEMPGDYQEVLKSLGKQGDYKSNVFKVNIPRNDLKEAVDGVGTPTPFGFGGWLAMTKGDRGRDFMMGDLVLLQEEVNPVMWALLDNGLEVTALHNHFLFEEPRIFYMHVMGHGRAADLARMANPALDLIGHISQRRANSEVAGKSSLQQAKIDKAAQTAIQLLSGAGQLPRNHRSIGR
jgi:hypothetical protein